MRQRSALANFVPALLLMFVCAIPAKAETPSYEELRRRLKQQGERIDRLEEAVLTLQSQGGGTQQRRAATSEQIDPEDPVIGTWQCTNGVFTYNMTFFADGLLLQESTTFGPMRELSWKRLSSDELLLQGDVKMRTSFSAEDRMTAENPANMAKWECDKVLY